MHAATAGVIFPAVERANETAVAHAAVGEIGAHVRAVTRENDRLTVMTEKADEALPAGKVETDGAARELAG